MPKWTSKKPWERQDGERTKAFEAFSVYLELGADRSQQAVSKKLAKSRQIISRWSAAYDWVNRAEAYDADLQKRAHAEAVKGRREMVERHIELALKMQEKALAALECLHPAELAAKDVIAMAREGTRLEQEMRSAQADGFAPQEGEENGNAVTIYLPANGRDQP